MGRLQRKKSPTDKKRVGRNADAADTGTATGADNAVEAGATVKTLPVTKKGGPPARPVAKVREPNFIDKSIQFLREVKVELKKVVWPSRKQTIASTIVVIVLVSIVSMFLGLVDIILGKLIQLVLG